LYFSKISKKNQNIFIIFEKTFLYFFKIKKILKTLQILSELKNSKKIVNLKKNNNFQKFYVSTRVSITFGVKLRKTGV